MARVLTVVAAILAASPDSASGQPLSFADRLAAAAISQTAARVEYDGSYRRIPYPGGDVPASVGVCTDVVIRAYRSIGIDLQVKVHEDMLEAFGAYPQSWGMAGPDSNIDHRRVPNLQTFFLRHGARRKPPATLPHTWLATW